MKEASCTWNKAMVGVCTKCHKAIDENSLSQEGNCGENLKNFLKAQLRGLGHAGAVRVVNTSCLGLCPEGEQAVVLSVNESASKMLVLHPEKEREELLSTIVSSISAN